MTVDVNDPVPGWVDVLALPEEPEQWPQLGRKGLFEVLQHRGFEIRLLPLDASMRGRTARNWRRWGHEWAALTQRFPVRTVLDATVDHVFPGNREYTVRFGDYYEAVEYEGSPPGLGAVVSVVVVRRSEWTRSLILQPRKKS
ncbi:hypothetical protein [Actinoplanes solisilvae]|uniref:hypothetical protein n=1 Tax=Actinoplanes solisilvae TaxID=2486853 RepID=UPI0013E3432A|nr:hypothetical protein [Actinoplanes solisilvae]